MKHKEQSLAILAQMTTEEKVALQTGQGAWNTCGVPRLGVAQLTVSDGPHGLRKEVESPSGKQTLKSVCFPTASKLAASFNRALMREVGAALGEQCRMEDVDILLGPAINIKRNPRCGRNFEYFSEDPYLTGELACAYIKGVQSQGVGVSLKHFAANSQEYGRFVCDSVIDQRCLHEIYLAAFENVVKNASPDTVMCAYNKINGEYCSQNKYLLNDVLRNKWGYKGTVVTDWGATDDRVAGISAGLDLQMPQGETQSVTQALGDNSLDAAALDQAVLNILDTTLTLCERTHRNADYEYQHVLARRVSAECTVLLKNTCNTLPFMKMDRIAVIGALAEKPHYQGGGSSCVNAYRVDSLVEALRQSGIDFQYKPAYRLDGQEDLQLLKEAVELAQSAQKVVLMVGLTDGEESEGFDRRDLKLPGVQLNVIDAVTAANSNVVIVLQCGAPVETDWVNSAKAVVLDYMGGESQGSALAAVLFGETNPSGRLAETWPQTEPLYMQNYSTNPKMALYKESIYVGYRYYTTANVNVAFPFGYGLDYTDYSWKDISLSQTEIEKNGKVNVLLTVTNTGAREGSEVVQIYVRNKDCKMFTADRELKAFAKVTLKPGQSKALSIPLSVKSFGLYNVDKDEFEVNGGNYDILVCKNASHIVETLPLFVIGENDTQDSCDQLSQYYSVDQSFNPSDQTFATLLGRDIPDYRRTVKQPHTLNSTLDDIRDRLVGRFVCKKEAARYPHGLSKQDRAMPLRSLVMHEDVNIKMLNALLEMLNGKIFSGAIKYFKESLIHKRNLKAKNAVKKIDKAEKESKKK